MKTSVLIIFLLLSIKTIGQVSGTIKSADAAPVPGAIAFIRNTSISAVTDEVGAFMLQGIAPGYVEIVVYKNGFQLFKSPLRIVEGKTSKLTLKLTPEPAVTIPTGSDALKSSTFKDSFLGTSPLAARCKILNPKALQLISGDVQKIGFKEPVVVENSASGYRLIFYLTKEVEATTLLAQVIVRYDTMAPSNSQQLSEWRHVREALYFGSRQHFLSSLANGQTVEQGFRLVDKKMKTVPADSIVGNSKVAGYRKVKFRDTLEVRFKQNNNDSVAVISKITAPDPFDVSFAGTPLNDLAISISGAMKKGVADWFPYNFFPAATIAGRENARELIKLLREKIYVQTDKPYYYPGEPLWFKAYINSFVNEYRDSLSKIIYVDLIAPDKAMVMSRRLKIEHAASWGDFILPASLPAGNYYLRAYTNLQRNFGDESFFVKRIPIVGITDRADPLQSRTASTVANTVSITADKQRYKPRQKIKANIKTTDNHGKPVAANLSISVTDATQVVDIAGESITRVLPFDSIPAKGVPSALGYPIETGISFSGNFLNDKAKPEKAKLSIIQGKMENMIFRDTDDNGFFYETGYDFYDSVDFLIQAKKENGKVYGHVNLKKQDVPSLEFLPTFDDLKVISTNKPQRLISEYEVPLDAKVLQEVTITEKKLVASEFVTQRFGRPSRMIDGKDLQGSDLLFSLMVMIPGLKQSSTGTGFTQVQTINLPTGVRSANNAVIEPLIYVNEVLRGGGNNVSAQLGPGAVEVLERIIPSEVDHVEVISTQNSMISVQNGNGMIAIFLKPGARMRKSFDAFRIAGYDHPRSFTSPDYEDSTTTPNMNDLRATLYWNPIVPIYKTGEGTDISFFASDLNGRYRIVVEGVTESGVPVRGEAFVEVDVR